MYDKNIKRGGYTRGLRYACRKVSALIVLLTVGLGLGARTYPNGLSSASVDPVGDSIALLRIRAHLDSVRVVCGRPTVALVLGGGGAKGAAEVGFLKYIEEKKIPIDFVCGTSIGGLVGGMYSLGYKAADLEEMFRNQDWGVTLTDKVDGKYFTYSKKLYKSTYIFSIPFHYSRDDRELRKKEGERYDSGLHMGASRKESGDFLQSLPSGYVYGFNVNNLLSSVSVGYQDSISFVKMPIPFACVSSDLVSGKAVNSFSGDLKTSMRSTMGIPMLFKPVHKDGKVMVDGGLRNNFPTDIAKAVGADYIIAVDLSDADLSYSQVNNVGNVFMQMINMLGRETFATNLNYSDVFVKPVTYGFSSMSFNRDAVDTLLKRGYDAAVQVELDIDSVKMAVGADTTRLQAPRAVDIRKRRVQIGEIEFEGLSFAESRYLRRKIKLFPADSVGSAEMNKAMSILQATGSFETVSYSLKGNSEPYKLVFNCRRGPVHQLGAGLRLDTEDWVSLALNLGLNTHKLMGSKFDLSARIGSNQSVAARYSFVMPDLPTINVDADFRHYLGSISAEVFSYGGSVVPRDRFEYISNHTRFFLSNMSWKMFDINAGISSNCYALVDDSDYTVRFRKENPDDDTSWAYLGGFIHAGCFTLDDKYYPSRGMKVSLRYDVDFVHFGCNDGFKPIHMVSGSIMGVIPMGKIFSLIPDFQYRSVVNDNTANDYVQSNMVGGLLPGRYGEYHMPYFGCNQMFIAADHLAVLTLSLRVKVWRNFYASVLCGGLRNSALFPDLFTKNGYTDYSAGMEAAFNSVAGPFKFNVHWSKTFGWGAYFSFGFDF